MQNAKPNNEREDSRKASSSDDRRGTVGTIARFLCRTSAILVLAAVAYALPAQSQAQTIVTFDPPGSVRTIVGGISPVGTITGGYADASQKSFGFLRTPDGQFTTFDAPGDLSLGPQGISINSAGEITGSYGTPGPVIGGMQF